MGLIDYSPMFREPGPSPAARGMRSFGSVLDAIMDRRARMQAEKAKREQEMAIAKMEDERVRDYNAQQYMQGQQQEERLRASAEAQAANMQAQQEQAARTARTQATEKALGAYRKGDQGAGQALLGTQGMSLRQRQADPMLMLEPEMSEEMELALPAGETPNAVSIPTGRSRYDVEQERLAGKQELVMPGGETAPWEPETPESVEGDVFEQAKRQYLGMQLPPREAELMAAQTAREAARDKGGEAVRDKLQGDRAMRRALVAGRVKPSQAIDDARALANSAAALLNQELSREDYRAQATGIRDTQLMLDLLSSNNAAAHKRAMGIMAKQASGPGAVTDSERDYFVNTVGGKDEQVKAWAYTWLQGGEVPESQRKIFAEATKGIIMRKQAEVLSDLQANVRDSFENHPNPEFRVYADWAANRVAPSVLGGVRGKKAGKPTKPAAPAQQVTPAKAKSKALADELW